MEIFYSDIESFHDGVYAMLKRGITFQAFQDDLKIVLTGGY